jgi:fructokinase
VISIGEVLWDVFGEEAHLGGAPFNFAAQLQRLGHEVSFVSAIGEDERGDRILARMSAMGLSTEYVSRDDGTDSPHSTSIDQLPTISRD